MKESQFKCRPSTPQSSSLLEQIFRSDHLPVMIDLLCQLRLHHPQLTDVIAVSVAIDANKINSEIRWRLGKRQKPSALSHLFEGIKAGIFIPLAPPQLADEILQHAPEIAADTRTRVEDVLKEWATVRPSLKFHPPAMQQIEIIRLVDADDLIYMATQQQLGLPAVYTDDNHLKKMGAPTVRGRIDRDLRDYARGTAVKVGVSIGSGVVVMVPSRDGRRARCVPRGLACRVWTGTNPSCDGSGQIRCRMLSRILFVVRSAGVGLGSGEAV